LFQQLLKEQTEENRETLQTLTREERKGQEEWIRDDEEIRIWMRG